MVRMIKKLTDLVTKLFGSDSINPKFMQTGIITIPSIPENGGANVTLTFPVAFDNPPAVMLTGVSAVDTNTSAYSLRVPSTSKTAATIRGLTHHGTGYTSVQVRWLAIDPYFDSVTISPPSTSGDGIKTIIKEISMGALVNEGRKTLAHGLTSAQLAKVIRVYAKASFGNGEVLFLPSIHPSIYNYHATVGYTTQNVFIQCYGNFTSVTATAFIEYEVN